MSSATNSHPLKYLIRKTGTKQKAHIWLGSDTACRMWSTGGLRRDRYEVRDDRGNHAVCHMCKPISERTSERLQAET